MEQLEKIKLLTGESNEGLLSLLLEEAENRILVYTNRKKMPKGLLTIQLDMAVIAYNKLGSEGATSHSEGGISVSFEEMPKSVYEMLNKYRLARVGGAVYEEKAT